MLGINGILQEGAAHYLRERIVDLRVIFGSNYCRVEVTAPTSHLIRESLGRFLTDTELFVGQHLKDEQKGSR